MPTFPGTTSPLRMTMWSLPCVSSAPSCQQAQIETDTIGQWLYRMNYAYHEVKTFLASEFFDTGRHYSVFRQRALAHGGALGLESAGQFNRRLMEARAGWTEVVIFLYIIRGTLTLMLYRYGEAYSRNTADKYIFRRCMEDKARHMRYGMQHLKYAVDHREPAFALGLNNQMRGVERDLVQDFKDPVLWETLAIIFGGASPICPRAWKWSNASKRNTSSIT